MKRLEHLNVVVVAVAVAVVTTGAAATAASALVVQSLDREEERNWSRGLLVLGRQEVLVAKSRWRARWVFRSRTI